MTNDNEQLFVSYKQRILSTDGQYCFWPVVSLGIRSLEVTPLSGNRYQVLM